MGLAVTGCTMSAPEAEMGAQTAALGPRSVRLSTSGVTIAGPAGFCVDPTSVKDQKSGGFALVLPCAGPGRLPAVLSLSVSPPATTAAHFDPGTVLAFFTSEAGRQALSRSGQAQSVTLLESKISGQTLWLHARDTAAPLVPGGSEEYWRAIFVLNGQIMTATASFLADKPMSSSGLKSVLRDFQTALVRQNRG